MILDEVTGFDEALARAGGQLRSVLASESFDGFSGVDDAGLVGLVSRVEAVGRLVDTLRVYVAFQVQARSSTVANADPDFSLAHAYGFKNARSLLQNLTGAPGAEVSARLKLGAAVSSRASMSGEVLPPVCEHVAEVFSQGRIDKSTASLIVAGLERLGPLVDPEKVRFAQQQLVEQAAWACAGAGPGAEFDTGTVLDGQSAVGADAGAGGFPVHADNMRVIASAWCAALDQDGTPPAGEQMAKRFFVIGRERDGLVPIRGAVLPEVAAKIGRFFDAHLNPRVRFKEDPAELAGVSFEDERSSAQKRHDAFATAINLALKSSENPFLGGEAVSLVVQVTEENLTKKNGVAWVEDAYGEPVPIHSSIARHASCVGSVQKVVQDTNGKIVSLGTKARVFNAQQRKAILLRDGGCVIPGCDTPSSWCEIHHVEEHARGGPTHTDNGVALCWFHHRHIETHGWDIRMCDGVVEVCPPGWLDPGRRWLRRRESRLLESA